MAEAEENAPQRARPWSRGAEASLVPVDWLGLSALRKDRETKVYRPKALDERLRRERTRTEARLLVDARRLGVRTPLLYDIDLARYRLVMERLEGPTLRDRLERERSDEAALGRAVRGFGTVVGRLHAGGIAHGDLTSSNVLFPEGPDGPPALLDFSMGERNAGIEERGIDLHLVEEDLRALHPEGATLFRSFLQGYRDGNPAGHADVEARARAIKGRVRYA